MTTNNCNNRLCKSTFIAINRCTLDISKKFSLLTFESLAMNVAFLKVEK